VEDMPPIHLEELFSILERATAGEIAMAALHDSLHHLENARSASLLIAKQAAADSALKRATEALDNSLAQISALISPLPRVYRHGGIPFLPPGEAWRWSMDRHAAFLRLHHLNPSYAERLDESVAELQIDTRIIDASIKILATQAMATLESDRHYGPPGLYVCNEGGDTLKLILSLVEPLGGYGQIGDTVGIRLLEQLAIANEGFIEIGPAKAPPKITVRIKGRSSPK
jgi:hypothetical protein